MTSRPSRAVLVAFGVFTLMGGANAIGVKIVLEELAPFWGAAFRFAVGGVILGALTIATGRRLPTGERLVGAVLFGLFGFGLSYFFIYWGLQDAPAGTTMLILAIVPLLTLLLAVAQRVERLRRLGLAGALIAAVGVLVVSADQVSLNVPIAALVALIFGAVCIAESGVAVKRFPPGDPVAANTVGMLLGAAFLGAAALVTGEPIVLPSRPDVWLAMLYLIGPGSVLLFILALYILARWTASATSYAFLLFPLVGIGLGATMLREPIQATFIVGGAVVLLGVYVGAIYRPRRAVPATAESEAEAAPAPS